MQEKSPAVRISGRAFSKSLLACSSFTSTSRSELWLFSAGLDDHADSEADLTG
jgi:hypothetical protein